MLQNEKGGRESEPVANKTAVTVRNKIVVDSNSRRHEPARRFQSNRFRQKRNFMFVAWSAIFLYFSIASEFQNRAAALPSQSSSFAPEVSLNFDEGKLSLRDFLNCSLYNCFLSTGFSKFFSSGQASHPYSSK